MSSLKRAGKSNQRLHHERHQPANRRHLGYLEKKKDYKLRANDFQKKENTIKLLRQKALDKNPDEFYFHMINSKLKDGVHFEKRKDEYTDEEIKLMRSQDLNYVKLKRAIELNKIEKLKSNLHLIDVFDKPKNNHIFFVDSKKEAKKFDFAKKLNTDPSLLSRSFNYPDIEKMKSDVIVDVDDKTIGNVAKLRTKSYKELLKRMEREKMLKLLIDKIEAKKKFANKKEGRPETVKKGTKTNAAVYKWRKERKR